MKLYVFQLSIAKVALANLVPEDFPQFLRFPGINCPEKQGYRLKASLQPTFFQDLAHQYLFSIKIFKYIFFKKKKKLKGHKKCKKEMPLTMNQHKHNR